MPHSYLTGISMWHINAVWLLLTICYFGCRWTFCIYINFSYQRKPKTEEFQMQRTEEVEVKYAVPSRWRNSWRIKQPKSMKILLEINNSCKLKLRPCDKRQPTVTNCEFIRWKFQSSEYERNSQISSEEPCTTTGHWTRSVSTAARCDFVIFF